MDMFHFKNIANSDHRCMAGLKTWWVFLLFRGGPPFEATVREGKCH
jgi:hypothetical protein